MTVTLAPSGERVAFDADTADLEGPLFVLRKWVRLNGRRRSKL